MIFEQKPIRQIEHNGMLYFAAVDIISVLVETASPSQYWTKIKNNLTAESQLQPFWLQLKVKAADGKNYKTDCANTEGVLRIIMSVPSPKAEPLKLWLAQVGKEQLEEIADPEVGFDRLRDVYRAKGYADEWIERRMQSIETRKNLTDEWKDRGVKEGQEYAILTAEIAKATFGVTPSEHSKLKGLERHNLRDHMTPIELIFTALSEESTRIIAKSDDAIGFAENHNAAQRGGNIAGNARRRLEKESGEKIVSSTNFLEILPPSE